MDNTKEKYISEASMKDKPKKSIGLFLRDKSVTTKKLADESVTEEKLADNAISSDKIKDGNVDFEKLNEETQDLIKSSTGVDSPLIEDMTKWNKRITALEEEDKNDKEHLRNIDNKDAEQDKHLKQLDEQDKAFNDTLENISKNGEASAASNVTYNPNNSGLTATNTQNAIDEVYKKSNYNDGENIIDFNSIHLTKDNPEYFACLLDTEGKIVIGIRNNADVYYGAGVPTQIKDYVSKQVNQILEVEDVTSKIDSLREIEAFLEDFSNSDTLKALLDTKANSDDVIDIYKKSNLNDSEGNIVNTNTIFSIEDNSEYIEATVDGDGKTLLSRDKEGNLVEYVGFKSPKVNTDLLVLSQKGKENFSQSLNSIADYSKDTFVELPMPKECSKVNIIIEGEMPVANSDETEGYIEYIDKYGNYFKKKISGLEIQGDSSRNFPWKNYKFDIDDDSKIKFGDWVAQDSFHLKKYYSDVFRGQCIVAYWLAEQMYQSRELSDRYPYSYIYASEDVANGQGSFKKDFPTGAMTHPDGFPIKLYVNGEYKGIWDWNLKKDKDNYAMSKDNTDMLLLDGTLGIEFFGGTITWSDFEVRNPKPKKKDNGWELITIDGKKYDGDAPKEFIGETTVQDEEKGTVAYDTTNKSHVNSAKVKANIIALSKAIADIKSQATDEGKKSKFNEYFKENEVIDYFLFGNVTYDFDGFRKNWLWCTWDGKKWSPVIYDKDNIFGVSIFGVPSYIDNSVTNLLGTSTDIPSGLCYSLFADDVKAEYKRLRDNGIFTEKNITGLLEKWIKKVGYDNLKEEIDDICVDGNGIPQTPSYRPAKDAEGNDITYSLFPTTGGIYNSLQRVSNWLVKRISNLDSVFEYNAK